jgi:cytidylate kinase
VVKRKVVKKLNIAIDGPAGSGKTVVSKLLAQKLKYNFLDSGLLYRHFALFIKNLLLNENKIFSQSITTDFLKINETISQWQESFANDQEKFVANLEKDRDLLSLSEVSDLASQLSTNPNLRKITLDFQRKLTTQKGWVVVGRDITSEVLPNAEVKIFLTANLEIRSRRRYEQYPEKMSLDEVKKELKKRDERDTKRNISPLKKTADSW